MSNCTLYGGVVSIKEFDTYTQNYEETEEVVRMKINILQAAQSVVESYLNYKLESHLCVDEHIGCNNSTLYLNSRPVSMIHWITVNEAELEDYGFSFDSIYRTDGKTFGYSDRVKVKYETNVTAVPPLIKQTILRIATLMLTEANENIGVTSITAPDGMGRTFLNYTSYSKYLEPLKDYKVFRL